MQLSAPGLGQIEQFAISFPGTEDSAGQIGVQCTGTVIANTLHYFVSNFGVDSRYFDFEWIVDIQRFEDEEKQVNSMWQSQGMNRGADAVAGNVKLSGELQQVHLKRLVFLFFVKFDFIYQSIKA
ncbi:MAG: hypothetical protein MUO63_20010 [Desulfobulbaceae bacterium]|nr:hypothetical protein [Desulfobulbaceae bacterium]